LKPGHGGDASAIPGNAGLGPAWRRRLVSFPALLLAFALMLALFPVLLVAAAVHGMVVRSRWSALRLLLFAVVFLCWEIGGLLVGGLIWIGWFGRWRSEAYLEANHRLQWAWGASLLRVARSLFQVSVEIEDDYGFPGRPIILLVRHSSFADSLIAVSFVSWRHRYRLRYVLKEELLRDPCLDLVGRRLPNAFIPRKGLGAGAAVSAVGFLARGLAPREGVLIYPEGTRFSEAKRVRAIESLAEHWPDLADRARNFRNVLPPRTAGVHELLEQAPEDCDVVFCAHVGLEGVMQPWDVLRGGLAGQTVRIRFWGMPANELPKDEIDRRHWLFAQWSEVDRFVGDTPD